MARQHTPRRVSALIAVAATTLTMTFATTTHASAERSATSSGVGCGDPVLKDDGTPWSCTFADDFTGDTLSSSKWSVLTTANSGFSPGGDCYVDSPDNIAVSDGALRLTTRRHAQPVTCKNGSKTVTSTITSADITTLTKFSQAYGRFEIRAKMPATSGPGTHAAWWLWPEKNTYGVWPFSGEIDVMEYYSQYPDRAIPQLHYAPTNNEKASARSNYFCTIDDPTQFHTYTAEWTPDSVTISYDGQTCLSYRFKPAYSYVDQVLDTMDAGKPFDRLFGLALTHGAGVGANAATPSTRFPATMTVDYVRVWS